MKSISEFLSSIDTDVNAVSDWVNAMYNKDFAEHFKTQSNLYQRLQDKRVIISDEELEDILTVIPLDLFVVSEKLASLKLKQEVIKLKTKEHEIEVLNNPTLSDLSDSKKKEIAANETLEHKLTTSAITNLITRVESEIAFSKELIMSAKKIWDRRRDTENAGAISPNSNIPDLPDYVEG